MFSRIRSIIPTDARNYALLTHTHTLDAAALPRTSFAWTSPTELVERSHSLARPGKQRVMHAQLDYRRHC